MFRETQWMVPHKLNVWGQEYNICIVYKLQKAKVLSVLLYNNSSERWIGLPKREPKCKKILFQQMHRMTRHPTAMTLKIMRSPVAITPIHIAYKTWKVQRFPRHRLFFRHTRQIAFTTNTNEWAHNGLAESNDKDGWYTLCTNWGPKLYYLLLYGDRCKSCMPIFKEFYISFALRRTMPQKF